jgi:HEXXH motif-containing protein
MATHALRGPLVGTELFNGATFLPNDEPVKLDALLEAVWRKRFTTFVTAALELEAAAPELCVSSGFSSAVFDVLGQPEAYRRKLVGDPAFLVWLGLTMVAVNKVLTGAARTERPLERVLAEFSSMRRRFDERSAPGAALRLQRTDVLVQRFDVDLLIARVTPPSYEFPSTKNAKAELERVGHSLSFFRDVAGVALDRIETAWPECYSQIVRLVKALVYVPDATFRSCSASRYTGVVYLTAKDNSILDLEESIVHEAGHQLLYTIVELEPVSREDVDVDDQYTLPWSGQQRDFYGYFHAFYIYTLLAKYFERVAGRSEDEQRRAFDRMIFILDGLVRALPDFEGNEGFTPHGAELLENLGAEIEELADRHRAALKARSVARTAGSTGARRRAVARTAG